MEKKIVLIGGGGHCKSVLDTLLRCKAYAEIVITDYGVPAGTRILGCEVVGNDDVLSALLSRGFTDAFITIGSIKSTKLRRILYAKAEQLGFTLPNIVDDSAVVSAFATLGNGVFVGKNAVINADAVIENAAIINTAAVIEHECKVGAFTHVSVGAKLCGNVMVGADCMVGAGSVVIQGTTIGNGALIGAGSTVIRDVSEQAVRVGLVK